MSKCASAGTRVKGLTAISLLTVIGFILVLAATGCGDAGPNAPDDLPVATSSPAGSVKPVNTASSADAGPAAPDDLPVATSTPAGSVKPVNTVSSADGGPAAPDDQPVATTTPAGSAKPVYTASTGDGVWLLELLDGQPIIEKSVVTMRINGDQIEGFDGCNHYQGPIYVGPIEDGTPVAGTPVAGPDGVFSLPSYAVSEVGCGESRGSQADEYWSALHRGERYRVAGDRLEILDGEGATRLVFVREAPLPRQPVDLRGTSWRLITEDDVDNDERVTTLIFNGRQVTGSTACRDYLASYEMSEGSVRFPSISMLGSVESCSESARRRQGEYTDFLSWAWEYSVHEEQGVSRLRIRSYRGKTLTFEPLP